MLNINNKPWDELRFSDVEALLSLDDDETIFFEYKNDKTKTHDVAEEVCAFANTYGGYLLLGIENDKSVTGCAQWTEQKIHTTLHDSITPTPVFDVKKFKTKQGVVFVVRIEEGGFPPYITSKGKIMHRVSSGSYTVKDSYTLSQMFNKRKDSLDNIEKKISIDEIHFPTNVPNNMCAYLDLGFSPSFHDIVKTKNDFFDVDLQELSKAAKKVLKNCTISRIGYSIVITSGEISVSSGNEKIAAPAGVNNFIEIMPDGSVRCRVCFALVEGTSNALVSQTSVISFAFALIYKTIFGDKLFKNFISAQKYEKLVVTKQFTPIYDENQGLNGEKNKQRAVHHKSVFGGNIIVTTNRFPKVDYNTIDRQFLDILGLKYNNENLISELFFVDHYSMGFFSDKESGFDES